MSDEVQTPTTNFWSFLREHKHGSLHSELTERMNELVAACIEHGKTGSLTLKLNVAPMKDSVMVRITDDVTSKVPEADRGGSFFFSDETGGLHREDPNQMKLDTELRVVETPDEVVAVDTTTGEVINLG